METVVVRRKRGKIISFKGAQEIIVRFIGVRMNNNNKNRSIAVAMAALLIISTSVITIPAQAPSTFFESSSSNNDDHHTTTSSSIGEQLQQLYPSSSSSPSAAKAEIDKSKLNTVRLPFIENDGINSVGQETAAKTSNTVIRDVSELISLNPTHVARDISIPEQNRNCGNFQVKIEVGSDVLYENDKLIIQGYAPQGAKLEGLLIPLDGVTHGISVDIPLTGSHFVYLLHQFGPEDKKLKYAAIVNAVKETNDGTCVLGDYMIIDYKGSRK